MEQESETRKCPYCKELINKDAVICKHCGKKITKPMSNRRKIVYASIFTIFMIIVIAGGNSSSTTPSVQAPQVTAEEKTKAQSDLDSLIALSKKAGLVTSYEFSDSASVVYVGKVWYTQTVEFKKDFIAKIAMLKKTITGFSHFEVKDAYSNEKVGELTSFSSSIEVYK